MRNDKTTRKGKKMNKQTIKMILGITCVSILIFMMGRVSNNIRKSEVISEAQEFSYVIESGYVPSEINFEQEAKYIKNYFNPSMSEYLEDLVTDIKDKNDHSQIFDNDDGYYETFEQTDFTKMEIM